MISGDAGQLFNYCIFSPHQHSDGETFDFAQTVAGTKLVEKLSKNYGTSPKVVLLRCSIIVGIGRKDVDKRVNILNMD